jgi:hypothetical protein
MDAATLVTLRLAAMYGHILKMATAFKEGVDSVEGCEGALLRIPETLPADGEVWRGRLDSLPDARADSRAVGLHPPLPLLERVPLQNDHSGSQFWRRWAPQR